MNQNQQNHLASLIHRISGFQPEDMDQTYGRVVFVADGIIEVRGLPDTMSGELLRLNNDLYALAMNLEENKIGAILLGPDAQVRENDYVYRTGEVAEVGVGDTLLGRVVDALGRPLDGNGPILSTISVPIERPAPSVMARESVNVPLRTGTKLIDAIVPIGRGQRELIIGDRQSGKTTLALNAIRNQKDQNVLCVYVAIGQKSASVARINEQLRESGADRYTVVVSSSAADPAALQYLAPYTGCAIAEYWMDRGRDVLIVYDDLSKHAVAYRTISLLLRRPSGREAYPGDVFYLHARLLERAAKLNQEHGGGSMSALPIIETQAGDISAYIPTNVISITDGQLFLDLDAFNGGQRPALDSGLSVSRVGSSAQTPLVRQMASALKYELSTYEELASFTQFSSELEPATKRVIEHGKRLKGLLNQNQQSLFSEQQLVLSLMLNKYGYLDHLPPEEISAFEAHVHTRFADGYPKLMDLLSKGQKLSDEEVSNVNQVLTHLLDYWTNEVSL